MTESAQKGGSPLFLLRYRSVIGNGTAFILEDSAAKKTALDRIMSQYSEGSYTYPEQMLSRTTVVRITIGSITGKQS